MITTKSPAGAPRRAPLMSWHLPALLAIGGSIIAGCSSGSKGGGGLPAGVAAAIEILTQPPTSATTRVAFGSSVVVQVVDVNGDPVDTAGIGITAVLAGGGTLSGGAVVATNASGQATFPALMITGRTGTRQLQFTGSQLTGITSGNITLLAGPAARLLAASATSQNAVKGTAVATKPSVTVTDLDSNGVSGTLVTFAITGGNGSATGTTPTSGSNGVATVGSWTLDTAAGTNTMTASATGLTGSPVTFTATGTAVVSNFTITLQFLGSGTPSQQAAFDAAKSKWEQIIIGDLPNTTLSISNDTTCTSGGGSAATPLTYNGAVDDVVIFADLRAIDGPGGILGAAGPCIIRSQAQNSLTIMGYMKFDTADLANLEAGGNLDDVAFHEMGHVLGYGTLWNFPPHSLMNTNSSTNPFFLGAGANAAYLTEGGSASITPSGSNCSAGATEAIPRSAVPVENSGGPGTAQTHWEECVFYSEIMTGYISGTVRPVSLTTIRSMEDLGYTVNTGAAEPFNLGTQPTLRVAGSEPLIDLRDDVLKTPLVVLDQQGKVIQVYQR